VTLIDVGPCPACNGEGCHITTGIVYEPGCGHPHRGDVDHGPCPECQGTGSVEVEVETRTLDDLELEDFDMLEAALTR